jgi:glycine oxidase
VSSAATERGLDVVVVGAGIIGLAVAWRAAARGLTVAVVDPAPAQGASHVAAGMLAPVSEAHWGEEGLVPLMLDSAARWPAFAAELEAATGHAVDFAPSGTLVVGVDAGDVAVVDDLAQLHAGLGLEAARLRSRDCRDQEPLLAPGVRGGMLVPHDHRVDPRAVTAALQEALARAGVPVLAQEVLGLVRDRGRVTGVEVAAVGGALRSTARASRAAGTATISAATVVVAAGPATGALLGADGRAAPVRPVKGQLLVLRVRDEALALRRPVRGWAHGTPVYLVPRADGRVVVGATQEEQGFDTTVTAGAVHDLLRDASALVPSVLEHEVLEALAGLRPAAPDNAPVLGAVPGADGLVVATGHHRHGVLLAPATAEAVADVACGGALPAVAEPFAPDPGRWT